MAAILGCRLSAVMAPMAILLAPLRIFRGGIGVIMTVRRSTRGS
jgi:hypothetical protein